MLVRPHTAHAITRPPLGRSQSDSTTSIPRKSDPGHDPEQPIGKSFPPNSHHSSVLLKMRPSAFALRPEPAAAQISVAELPNATKPVRPPRNPARQPVVKQKLKHNRPNTATGTREEVTPWELHPVPSDTPVSPNASTSARTQPPSVGANMGGIHLSDLPLVRRRKSTGSKVHPKTPGLSAPQIHPSHSLPPSVSPSGNPATRQSSNPAAPAGGKSVPKAATATPAPLSPYVPPNFFPVSQSHPSSTPGPGAAPTTTSSTSHRLLTLPEPKEDHPSVNLKFSTADRTILEELKRNISARAAQFVFKGGPVAFQEQTFGWGTQHVGSGKKHHPYPKEEVPYPRNYEREVLDLDVWETAFCQQLSGSLTYHVFDRPPSRVLDLGCGTGVWVLNCARAWRASSFVGLDIVPLHPDLQQVGSGDLASRITWVQANFLDGLPFPNEEFDFVHVKRVALGVPEDKWDALFEEITRVMKPGAAFEMIEEDLFFPGKPPDESTSFDSDLEAEQTITQRSPQVAERLNLLQQSLPLSTGESVTRYLERTNHDRNHDSDSMTGSGSGSPRTSPLSLRRSDESISSPTTSVATSASPVVPHHHGLPLSTPPRSVSPLPPPPPTIAEDEEEEKAADTGEAAVPLVLNSVSKPQLRSRQPPTLQVQTNTSQRSSTFHHKPLSPGKFSGSTDWLISSLAPTPRRPQTSPSTENINKQSLRQNQSATNPINKPRLPAPAQNPTNPINRTSSSKSPTNPRDHSLLALIYTEMCESRFINLAPLSLLANLLVLHFQDVRSHPPLQFTFPPRPKSSVNVSELISDPDEEARNAIIPNPPTRSPGHTPRASESNRIPADENIDEESRFLSVRGLIKGSSQYVTLDDSRISAFSPSKKANFPAPTVTTVFDETLSSMDNRAPLKSHNQLPGTVKARAMSMRKNRLPNATLNIDLRTLNLHLALRTSEILACSESMWEWVETYQHTARARRLEESAKLTQRARSGSVESALHQRKQRSLRPSANQEPPSLKKILCELTRDEFDSLLNRFALDMQDYVSLGPALQERFSWSAFPSSPTLERKTFDNEYLHWLQWEREHRESQPKRRPTSVLISSSSYVDLESGRMSDIENHPSPGLSPNAFTRNKTHSLSTSIPPTRRLSRAMRVFVGWKPPAT